MGTDTTAKENAPLLGVVGGGFLAIVGPFLPWVKIETGLISLSRNGLDFGNDAMVIAAVGFLCLLAGIGTLTNVVRDRWVKGGAIVAGLVVIAVMVYDHQELENRVDDFAAASIGVGVWVSYLGGFLIMAGGFAYKDEASAPIPEETEEPA